MAAFSDELPAPVGLYHELWPVDKKPETPKELKMRELVDIVWSCVTPDAFRTVKSFDAWSWGAVRRALVEHFGVEQMGHTRRFWRNGTRITMPAPFPSVAVDEFATVQKPLGMAEEKPRWSPRWSLMASPMASPMPT